jgi:hypothetical protein
MLFYSVEKQKPGYLVFKATRLSVEVEDLKPVVQEIR